MGAAGFRALLARSLSLAAAELPWLRAVQVAADNTLEGFDNFEAQVDPDELSAGCTVLVAQLIGLLFAFIGEILTVRLMHDVWPRLSINDLDC